MKKILLSFLLTFAFFSSYSQKIDALIKFNDGKELRGVFKIRGNRLKSINSKTKYHIDDMREVTYYNKRDTIKYNVVDVKNNTTSKRSRRRLLRKIYEGEKLILYAITNQYQSGGTIGMTNYGTFEGAYVQRKNEKFAYDMGYLYGVQYEGIKKRVKKFFKDCPELVQKVKKNEIKKYNTLEMVLFYEKNCGN